MKITKVTPWLISTSRPNLDTANDNRAGGDREYLFVEVSTDEGVTGWGEVTAGSPRALPICAGLKHVSDLIAGDDPRLIEMIWNKIFRAYTYMGSRGLTTNMISAIDIALWGTFKARFWACRFRSCLAGPFVMVFRFTVIRRMDRLLKTPLNTPRRL